MNEWGWENSCSHHSLIKKKTHSWAPTVCQAVSGLGTQAWTGQRQPHVLVGETESKNCNQEWPSGEGTILSRVVRKDPLPGKKLKKKKICIKGDFPGGTLHFQCREHRFYHWLVNKKPIYLGEKKLKTCTMENLNTAKVSGTIWCSRHSASMVISSCLACLFHICTHPPSRIIIFSIFIIIFSSHIIWSVNISACSYKIKELFLNIVATVSEQYTFVQTLQILTLSKLILFHGN